MIGKECQILFKIPQPSLKARSCNPNPMFNKDCLQTRTLPQWTSEPTLWTTTNPFTKCKSCAIKKKMLSYLVFWAEQKGLNPFLQLTLDFEGATNATPLINPPRFVTDVFWPELNLVSWFRSDLSRNSASAEWEIHKLWVAITTQAAATPVLKMRTKPQTLTSISMLEIVQHPKNPSPAWI